MILYFRLFHLLITGYFKPRLHYKETVKMHTRVWLSDVDINKHMNNARYLSAMDLGRVDYMIQTGLLKTCIKKKWSPIVANIDISFYKSLDPWEKYTLETTLTSHDDKYFYMEQLFRKQDGVEAARANIKGLFIKGRQKVTPADVLAVLEK